MRAFRTAVPGLRSPEPIKIKQMKGKNRIPVNDSQIVDCLKRGLLPKQIGPTLGMKYRTVISRIEKLKKRMNCETLYQLVAEYGDKVAG